MARTTKGATQKERFRELLEEDLYAFAKYINPHYLYGELHEEAFRWLGSPDANDYQLLLMPRGHLKSHCIAVWCVWQITRDPCSTILYLSAAEDLAKAQIFAIKGMITCDRYRSIWPEMFQREEGKRSKWTAGGFNVDHPKRKEMGIRDMTILVKTLKSNSTGLHCDFEVFDDLVVPDNAYTETGRRDVRAASSQFSSLLNPGGVTKAVGTRYHPSDLYSDLKNTKYEIFDKETKEIVGEENLWEVREFVVESNGDLTGDYLWPRAVSPYGGKPHGYDIETMAKIRAGYFGKYEHAQFYAQYYNDPNDPSSEKLDRNDFSFYDKKHLTLDNGSWNFKGRKLNIFAAMDVAWTTKKSSDYTAIGVIGVDSDNNVYVLALDRFKTQDYQTYYDRVIALHAQWGFRKLQVETNAGGHLVAEELKTLLRKNGAALSIIGKAATGNEGKKEEKHQALLIPRIKNGGFYIFRDGLASVAIEEIVLAKPPHDDLKDVLTTAISISKPPSRSRTVEATNVRIKFNKRFGGRSR